MASKAKRSKKVAAAEASEPETELTEKPKWPISAYFAFLADFRVEMKNKLKPGDKIPTLAGERWRGMSEDEKEPYVTKATADRKEYEEKMEIWNKQKSKKK